LTGSGETGNGADVRAADRPPTGFSTGDFAAPEFRSDLLGEGLSWFFSLGIPRPTGLAELSDSFFAREPEPLGPLRLTLGPSSDPEGIARMAFSAASPNTEDSSPRCAM
jgi:hypothetical protein